MVCLRARRQGRLWDSLLKIPQIKAVIMILLRISFVPDTLILPTLKNMESEIIAGEDAVAQGKQVRVLQRVRLLKCFYSPLALLYKAES